MTKDSAPSAQEKTVSLLEETLDVSRREAVTGRVRVSTQTHEHTQFVDELLKQERVEVEHVPVDRYVESVPDIRQEDGTTIIPVVEEVLVVERRLRLKEEVHVRRVQTQTPFYEEVTLREQSVVVTRQDDEHSEPE